MFLNNLHVHPFIITKIIAKNQFENFAFSQLTLREISFLNRTTSLFTALIIYNQLYSVVYRTTVFQVSNQVRHKIGHAATEASYKGYRNEPKFSDR